MPQRLWPAMSGTPSAVSVSSRASSAERTSGWEARPCVGAREEKSRGPGRYRPTASRGASFLQAGKERRHCVRGSGPCHLPALSAYIPRRAQASFSEPRP